MVIIGRGTGAEGDLFVCQDGKTFNVHIFADKISENRTLLGRPKILLTDFSRGAEQNSGLTEDCRPARFPFGSDLAIGFSTTPGHTSFTQRGGSPFLTSFCQEVQNLDSPFQTIFTRVTGSVSSQEFNVEQDDGTFLPETQIPQLLSTLRLDLYLRKSGTSFYKF